MMRTPSVKVGDKYNRLLVIAEAERDKYGHNQFLCRCDCGTETTVSVYSLRNGNTKSCGCLKIEKLVDGNKGRTVHGKCKTKEHRHWLHIKERCTNPNCKGYKNYGGRGIAVAEEWANDFQSFYSHISSLPHFGEQGYSLDRIDNNGNYEPGNVRWATKAEQSNNKRTNHLVAAFGETHTMKEWAEITGLNYSTLRARLRRGETSEEALRPFERGN